MDESSPRSKSAKADQYAFLAHEAEGDAGKRHGEWPRAIGGYSRALELKAGDLSLLLRRSYCHQHAGDHKSALADVDAVLKEKPKYYKALIRKAEALFASGNFEFALVFFQRAHQQRPDLQECRLGIQKAKQAIADGISQSALHNSIKAQQRRYNRFKKQIVPGTPLEGSLEQTRSLPDASFLRTSSRSATTLPQITTLKSSGSLNIPPLQLADLNSSKRGTGTAPATNRTLSSSRRSARQIPQKRLLGPLYEDKKYLEELLGEDVMCHEITGKRNDPIINAVQDGLKFLDIRTEFWRQQQPPPRTDEEPYASSPSRASARSRSHLSASSRGMRTGRTLSERLSTRETATERARTAPAVPSNPSGSGHPLKKSGRRRLMQRSMTTQTAGGDLEIEFGSAGEREDASAAGMMRTSTLSKKKVVEQTKFAVDTLEHINEAIEIGDLERALKYAKAFLSRLSALEIGDKPKILGNLYSLMGTTYLELQKPTLAVIHHRKDLDISIKNDIRPAYMRALGNLGLTYEKMKDYRQALRMLEKKLEHAEQYPDLLQAEGTHVSQLLEDIGRCYYEAGDYENAIEFVERMLANAVEENDLVRQMSAHFTIGHTLMKQGKLKEAVGRFETYLRISRELGDHVAETNALTDLGNVYLQMGDVSKSIALQHEAIAVSARLNEEAVTSALATGGAGTEEVAS